MRASPFLPLLGAMLFACASNPVSDELDAGATSESEAPLEGSGDVFTRLAVVYTNNIDGEIEPCG